MNKKEVMIDLETLATTPNALILTIAGIKFDIDDDYLSLTDPYQLDHFYCRVSVESQPNRDIDDNTLAWWANQPAIAKEEAFSSEDRFHIADALTALNHWAKGSERYWANGSEFDYPIIETANKECNLQSPWNYWQVSDARTIYKLFPSVELPKPNVHHALYDCLNQIQKLNVCLKK